MLNFTSSLAKPKPHWTLVKFLRGGRSTRCDPRREGAAMCQRSPARVGRARSLRPRGCGGGSVPVAAPPLRSPPGPAGSSLLPHGILTPARAGAPPLPLASSPPAAAAAAASLGGAGAAPLSRAPAAGEAGGARAIAQRPLPIPPAAAQRHRHCPCCPVLSCPSLPSLPAVPGTFHTSLLSPPLKTGKFHSRL